MATNLKDALLSFVNQLRIEGVRISVAESLDAIHAVAVAGIEQVRMREALRAALIKDEADNVAFEEAFARCFHSPAIAAGASRRSRGAQIGVSGVGRGSGGGTAMPPAAPEPQSNPQSRPEPRSGKRPGEPPTKAAAGQQSEQSKARDECARGTAESVAETRSSIEGAGDSEQDQQSGQAEGVAKSDGIEDDPSKKNGAAGRVALLREIERTPFAAYNDLHYEQARDILAIVKRRLRIRLSRRTRIAPAGRLDFRRTIRAAMQRGGVFADLRFRARRPRHLELLILADLSGSVRYASTLMLDLMAGVRDLFRRVRSFVYVDRLAAADFERGHLVMEPALDLYARSDFGRVLTEIWERRAALLNRATLMIIMGDGRNNRRPSRADLLAEAAARCRLVLWLNPESPERWNTGDSAIGQYQRAIKNVIPCGDLEELEGSLGRIG